MECATACCIECLGATEIFQIWLDVTVEITVRIINFTLRIGPIGVVILVGGTVGYYYTFYDYGKAKAVSGHTIEIGKTQYRMYGVTALKPGQKLTWESGLTIKGFIYCRDALTAKIGRRKVRCKVFPKIEDRFGRTVAICSVRSQLGCRRVDLGRWLIRNGYALADTKYMEKRPILNGKYARLLEREEAFARKHNLGIHAGKFMRETRARDMFLEKWKARGNKGAPPFGSLDELQKAFQLEWQQDRLIDVKGRLFGGIDVSDYAHAAVDAV